MKRALLFSTLLCVFMSVSPLAQAALSLAQASSISTQLRQARPARK